MKLALVLSLVAAGWGSACASAEIRAVIAIKDAKVVTVSGEEWPKATVVMRNGLITDVGAAVSVPADAWVIDGNGLTVYPGFIDALSTWGIPAPPSANRGGAAQPATATPTAPEPRARGPACRILTAKIGRSATAPSRRS